MRNLKIEVPFELRQKVFCITDSKRKFHPYIAEGYIDRVIVTGKGTYIAIAATAEENEKSGWNGGKFAFSSISKSIFSNKQDAQNILMKGEQK